MLNDPLCTLAVELTTCEVAAIPNCPLSTFTTGRVEIQIPTTHAK